MPEVIQIRGLKEFNRGLRQVDRQAPKGLRLAGNKAADVIIQTALPRIPRRSGRAAGSVKAASTRTAARIQGGGSRAPYYPWLDFGGRVGRNNSVHRPFIREGRYIWAAFADRRPAVVETLHDELVKVAQSAGWDVS